MTYNLYFISISFYLFIILTLGIYFSKGIKTVQSFAIADKKFGTAVLLMTFLATSLGAGSTVGDTAKIMRDGIVFPLSMLGFFFFCYYMSKYVAHRFDKRFEGMVSAGDIIEYFYGCKAAKIASFFGFVAGALTVGAQITGLGYLLEGMVSVPYTGIVFAVGLVITIYSALGGIKSVTATDFLQATIIIVIIPIFGFSIINQAGGINVVLSNAPARLYDIWNFENFRKYFAYFIVSFMPFLWLYPPVIQRFLMAKNSRQISKMYYLEFCVRIFLFVLLTLVASSSLILMPGVSPDSAISMLIKNFVPLSLGIFLMLGIISASMSTADSHLHSSAVLFSHNMCKSFVEKSKLGNHINEFQLLRVSTFILGVVATVVAIQKIEIVSLVILSFALSGAIIGIPLFFGVIGFKVSLSNFYGCFFTSSIMLIVSLTAWNISLINVSSIIILFGLTGFFAPNLRNYLKLRG